MLEAAGYPGRVGALSQVASHIKVPESTLRGWFSGAHNPPPAKVRAEKRFDLLEAIQGELAAIFPAMANRREDATYKELATAAGILVDKEQLLTGQPTERQEVNVTDHRERILAGIARKADQLTAGETREIHSQPVG
jgi:hypothetical protein